MSTAAKLIFPGYSPSNYAPTSGNTDGHLQGIDNALGTTPGASGGVQTFALGGGNTVASTIWSGPPGGQGNLYTAIAIPTGTFLATTFVAYRTQGGGSDSVQCAIYDFAGNRIAISNVITPGAAAGPDVLSFVTPTVLSGSSAYYFGLWTNANGNRYLAQTGGYNGAGPALGVLIPNSSGCPTTISLSNKQTTRFWVGVA